MTITFVVIIVLAIIGSLFVSYHICNAEMIDEDNDEINNITHI
jgi:hypothetical protein